MAEGGRSCCHRRSFDLRGSSPRQLRFCSRLEGSRTSRPHGGIPFPYGWQVLIPAYLTLAELVIACMLLAVWVWPGLSTKPGIRMLQFVALVLLMKGMLLPTFVYSFYSKTRLPLAMLSQSQFFFETLALAILTRSEERRV